MSLREALGNATQILAAAGVEDARANVEYLAAHAFGLTSRSKLRPVLEKEIPTSIERRFGELVGRRANREPLQYILGEWEFFGLPITISPVALIPRPETEILVEEALTEAGSIVGRISILDIGTGSGAIALALASRLTRATIVGIDISHPALELAEENRKLLALKNVKFQQTDSAWSNLNDWADSGPFDLIVSNPPYVSLAEFNALEPELRLFEPREALTDEANGLTFYERIAAIAPKLLLPNGRLLVELGFGAAHAVSEIVRSQGLEILRVVNDLAGIPRVLVARM